MKPLYKFILAASLLSGFLFFSATQAGADLYAIVPGASSGGGSGITRSVRSVSTATNAGATAATDYIYLVTGTTTVTLPTAVSNTDLYTVCNVDSSHTTTVATTSAQTINGSSTVTEAYQTCLNFISNNSNWIVN